MCNKNQSAQQQRRYSSFLFYSIFLFSLFLLSCFRGAAITSSSTTHHPLSLTFRTENKAHTHIHTHLQVKRKGNKRESQKTQREQDHIP